MDRRTDAEGPRRARLAPATCTVTHTEVVGEVEVTELPRLVAADASDPYRGTGLTEEPAPDLAASERRRIRFVAPDAPYTYDGVYFDVRWQLELVVENAGGVPDYERVAIRIAADG